VQPYELDIIWFAARCPWSTEAEQENFAHDVAQLMCEYDNLSEENARKITLKRYEDAKKV